MRTLGLVPISQNFEPKIAAPFDARNRVKTKAELYLEDTWKLSDGNLYIYGGMRVNVYEDGANNGIYSLPDPLLYYLEAGWERVGSLYIQDSTGTLFQGVQRVKFVGATIELVDGVYVVTGFEGPAGVSGVNYTGDYIPESTYQPRDVVRISNPLNPLLGNSYYCRSTVPVTGVEPGITEGWEVSWHIFTLRGAPGANGYTPVLGIDYFNGTDGREVVLGKSSTAIQWKYLGEEAWVDLIQISELVESVLNYYDISVTSIITGYTGYNSTDKEITILGTLNIGDRYLLDHPTNKSVSGVYTCDLNFIDNGTGLNMSSLTLLVDYRGLNTIRVKSVGVLYNSYDGYNVSTVGFVKSSTPGLSSDLTVNLSGGKLFGCIASGTTIPMGTSLENLIRQAAIESIPPTASISAVGNIPYNATTGSLTLNLVASSNNPGATITGFVIDFSRGDTNTWDILYSGSPKASHPVNLDTQLAINNTLSFKYRLSVTDSLGSTKEVSITVTPSAYAPPTCNISISGTREMGNASVDLNGQISRVAQNGVNVLSYELQYKVDSGSWIQISKVDYATPPAIPIAINLNHNSSAISQGTPSSVYYRVIVICTSATGNQPTTLSLGSINFTYYRYSGAVTAIPTGVDSLARRQAVIGSTPVAQPISAGTFIFQTGNIQKNFFICLPPGLRVSSILDTTANATVTPNPLVAYTMQDGGGNDRVHNMYGITLGQAFSSSHNWTITIGVI